MLGICLLGSGRMAHVYGPNVAAHPNMKLVGVVNPNLSSAEKVTEAYGGKAYPDVEDALSDPAVDAVIIATPTNTHLEYIDAVARAGKPILCEKPLDLDMGRVENCLAVLERHPVPFMLGFNRRFDPTVAAFREAVRSGEVGDLHMLVITNRDPEPPPPSYARTSGGYFCDSIIHDLDLARWILERYAESFTAMVDAFHKVVAEDAPPPITADDGRRALVLALACEQSRRDCRAIETGL